MTLTAFAYEEALKSAFAVWENVALVDFKGYTSGVVNNGGIFSLVDLHDRLGLAISDEEGTSSEVYVDMLNETFVRKLHERMFGKVWEWAGEYRRTNKNIGVDKTVNI